MDEVVERDGYIFGRKAKGYVAVTSMGVGDSYWEPKDIAMFRHVYGKDGEAMFARAKDYEYVVQGHATVWAIEMGSEKENGSFEAFMAGFQAGALTGDTHNFTFHSPTHGEMRCGWGKPLTVSGEEINIHNYQRYDNAVCQMAFDARRMDVACDGAKLHLDFDTLTRKD